MKDLITWHILGHSHRRSLKAVECYISGPVVSNRTETLIMKEERGEALTAVHFSIHNVLVNPSTKQRGVIKCVCPVLISSVSVDESLRVKFNNSPLN